MKHNLFLKSLIFVAISTLSASSWSQVYNCVGSTAAANNFDGPDGSCVAPTAGSTTSGSRTDNSLFTGINWTFGKKNMFEVIFGFRSAKTQYDGDTKGYSAQIAIPLNFDNISVDRIKVGAFAGKVDYMGGVGVGYSFAEMRPLVGVEITAPYFVAGVDYVFGAAKFNPYFGANTLGRLKKPNQGQGTACAPGTGTPVTLGARQPDANGSYNFLGGLSTYTGFDLSNPLTDYLNGSVTCYTPLGSGGPT